MIFRQVITVPVERDTVVEVCRHAGDLCGVSLYATDSSGRHSDKLRLKGDDYLTSILGIER